MRPVGRSHAGGRRESPAALWRGPLLIDLRVLEATRREFRAERRRELESHLVLELLDIEQLARECGYTVKLRHLEGL